MRRSEAYMSLASPEGMARLAQKYEIVEFIGGDQDWLTLLGWEMEELVHLLPCQFNRQIQAVINNEVSCYAIDQEMVEEYHKCEDKASILHFIGD